MLLTKNESFTTKFRSETLYILKSVILLIFIEWHKTKAYRRFISFFKWGVAPVHDVEVCPVVYALAGSTAWHWQALVPHHDGSPREAAALQYTWVPSDESSRKRTGRVRESDSLTAPSSLYDTWQNDRRRTAHGGHTTSQGTETSFIGTHCTNELTGPLFEDTLQKCRNYLNDTLYQWCNWCYKWLQKNKLMNITNISDRLLFICRLYINDKSLQYQAFKTWKKLHSWMKQK